MNLYKAFKESKELCFKGLDTTGSAETILSPGSFPRSKRQQGGHARGFVALTASGDQHVLEKKMVQLLLRTRIDRKEAYRGSLACQSKS